MKKYLLFLLLFQLNVNPASGQAINMEKTPNYDYAVIKNSEFSLYNFSHELINTFPEKFIYSLKECKPDIYEKKEWSQDTKRVEIIGSKNNRCHVKYEGFSLYMPIDALGNITTFNSLEDFVSNEDVAHYDNTDVYDVDIGFQLAMCYNNREAEENIKKISDTTISKGFTSVYINKMCILNMINKLSIKERVFDYSLICAVPQEKICELLDIYYPFVYPADSNKVPCASNWSRYRVDMNMNKSNESILNYLKENNFCRKVKKTEYYKDVSDFPSLGTTYF